MYPGINIRLGTVTLLCTCILSGISAAEKSENREPSLFWGDLHLHSSYSPDASMNGNINIGPEEAYRFASGEAIKGHNGQFARLARPLDFLLLADHAEYLGLLPQIRDRNPRVMSNDQARRWADLIESADQDDNWKAMFEVLKDIETNQPRIDNSLVLRTAWDHVIAAAEKYNEPGRFTALIGYEWTSMPGGNNLHRVVVFRDGAEKASQIVPFSAFDSEDPEDLWRFMSGYEAQTGGSVLAIPHNGNLSNGEMFAITDFKDNPIDRSYAEKRKHWEPLYEVTQIKGDGETHPAISPNDLYADFGTWDHGNLTSTVAKTEQMLRFEYARSALISGLSIQNRTGTNPYQFGMIGSTDAHTGFAAVAEDNFWGKFSVYEPGELRLTHKPIAKGKNGKAYDLWAYEMVSSGYAAIWAAENSRAAIFDAMRRREVYATTGSRIRLQFFAGWRFESGDANRVDFAKHGYSAGVPMGGEFGPRNSGEVPTIVYRAGKDPDGVSLAKVQIIKGWMDTDGSSHEQIYDVAATDSASEFAGFWRDPSFDPQISAFYYLRVLEVARKRWSTLEAERLSVSFNGNVPEMIQDRAYSSPVWYTP